MLCCSIAVSQSVIQWTEHRFGVLASSGVDTYGHATGDLVLQHVSNVLNASVRASDTVSRHGGDEFLIVLSEVRRASAAQSMAGKIATALGVPFDAAALRSVCPSA